LARRPVEKQKNTLDREASNAIDKTADIQANSAWERWRDGQSPGGRKEMGVW